VQDSAGQVVTATITVRYPTGLAAVVHVAELAFTGSAGLLRRRVVVPVSGLRRRG
jgi:hypothetical protein